MARSHLIPDWILDTAPTYVAGEIVSGGVYWEVDGDREVWLTHTGVLPASLDGRVAVYISRPHSLAFGTRASSPFEDLMTADGQEVGRFETGCASR